jgi:Lrp/AsnC family transcriptional regulator, regulator for asnA, asnC and gidA
MRQNSAIIGVMDPELDDIDLRILDALQDDARTPLVRLARALGVSDTTVRARIDRLIRHFGVKFVVDVEPEVLGLSYSFLAARVQGPAMARTIERMSELPEIIFLGRTLGGYDLMAELVCRNNNDMIRVLDAIRAIPGITQVDTYSVLRVEKENWRFTELARD